MDASSQNVTFYRIGTFIEIKGFCLESGESHLFWEIVENRMKMDESGIVVETDLLPVTDEADTLSETRITVNLDNHDFLCA